MEHVKLFEQFVNEELNEGIDANAKNLNEADSGLFPYQGDKDKNKFLFNGSDTITVPMKRVKIPPPTAWAWFEPVGNNYNFQALANQLQFWEYDYERAWIRYDLYPIISFTIPRVAKVVCEKYIEVEPIANLRTSAFSDGDGTDFNGHWYMGNSRGRGPAWMTGGGGSVKIKTVDIKERLSSVVGCSIRAAAVDSIDWGKINAIVQYKGKEPRLFDPRSNDMDLQKWVGTFTGIHGIWFGEIGRLENPDEFWRGIYPAVKQLEGMLPRDLEIKIKTARRK